MKRKAVYLALLTSLVTIAFYSLRGDNTVPDIALESVHLLKKPIEDLLPDLQEDQTNTEAVEQATLDLEPYQDLHNTREHWNEMRQLIETGQPLFNPLPSEIALSTSAVGRLAPAIPPPPGFTVQLPYESRLTVSGRKTIGFTYQYTTNSNLAIQQGVPSVTSSFLLQQQLQVRINGQIGRKVTVNVDFDDTKTDKQDISIVYKGDPDEIVQRAAFGDITLSLPNTEFAGYSKQVFGVSAELKYKALHGYFIGSRTKGTTETKVFTGNVILNRITIPDISYVRHKYYRFNTLTGVNIDTGTIKIYLDTEDTTRPANSITLPNTTATGAFIGFTSTGNYTGNFVQQNPGINYTIDPVQGIITFINVLQPNYVVAIDFNQIGQSQSYRTTTGQLALLKFDETNPVYNGQIPAPEDLYFYNIGTQKIVRDNGQGNFILQVQDLNGNNVGASLGVNYQPNNSGQIFVDFENGIFDLTTNNLRQNFPNIYAPVPQHYVSFFLQFNATVKTYTLRPNIVLNSEHILMNGRQLVRDVDYFIDYASGFLTFFNPDQITQDTTITATYDYSPFGVAGAQQDTLVGERTELSLYPIAPILGQSLIGSTVLYDFSPQQTSAPDIRQTAGSFLVTEADAHLKDLIFNPIPMLKSSFSAEGARSQRDPNTFGEALIDNMESIADESTVGMSEFNWQIARNPSDPISGAPGSVAYANALGLQTVPGGVPQNLNNETIPTLNINPNAAALSGDNTEVLDVSYDLTRSTEASIVTVLSPTGLDFTRKLYLQMYILGDASFTGSLGSGSHIEMNVALGQVNEDADNTGGGNFSDINGFHPCGNGTPRTEDLNYNGTLDSGEDVGWNYYDPNPDGSQAPNCSGNVEKIYANNLHLDSEDLDRNGFLNTQEVIASNIGYDSTDLTGAQNINQPGVTPAGSTPNSVDFNGWKYVQIPLEISSTTATSVKELRISLRVPANAVGTKGIIKIAKIAVTGNSWIPSFENTNSTVTATAVNTQDNGGPPWNYGSPSGVGDFDSLNQINTALSGPTPSRRLEQSLAMNYNFPAENPAGSSVTVTNTLTSAIDLTPYGSIRMFVHSDGYGNTFLFQAGSQASYCQFTIPVTWPANTWQEVYIQQVSSGNSQLPDHWTTDPRDPLGAVAQCFAPPGTPPVNLAQIQQFTAGVIHTNTSANNSISFWVDELFAADVITRIGYAASLKSDFEVFGWATFGANITDIDANFQTFSSAITNQARHEENAYLNLTRLSFFPMKFTALRRRTDTPNVLNTSNTNLVSILSQGRVDENSFSGTGTLTLPKIPTLTLLYDTDKMDTAALFRQDKTDHYGVTMDYKPASHYFFVPRTVDLGYRITHYKLDFGPDAILAPGTDPFSVSNTVDDTYDYTAKLAFQPLKNFTFNPNYALSTTQEFKNAIVSTDPVTGLPTAMQEMNYDKAKTQTAGFDGMLALRKWLAPRMRYSMTDTETYGIPLSTDLPGEPSSRFKSVDRTATGETTWDFAWKDFSNKWRPLQSLNIVSSYLMEDGDSWNNVASGYNTLSFLTVRQSLNPGNPEAQLANQTLRDTFRSTQRWSPFDWATYWKGPLQPLRTLSVTSTFTDTKQRQNTTGTVSTINTLIVPDLIMSLTQTEYFFRAQNWMSNSQMNIKSQYKTVNTENVSMEHASTNGGDWRFTVGKKLDVFFSYTRTTDTTFDEVNNVVSSDATGDTISAQLGFSVGKWRITPKYDQSDQTTVNSEGQPTTDLTKRTPAIQFYADLFLPAGLRLPFADLMVFSNRIRTTTTVSLTQQRSNLNTLNTNTDTYQLSTSEDYELTSNMRLTVGGSYGYTVDKVSSDANYYSYQFNSLLTIQF